MLAWAERIEEVRVLVERARGFLELARLSLERGLVDLAVFNAEQAAQLRLKATLLRLQGSYPRVHSLRYLLSSVSRILDDMGLSELSERVRGFVREGESLS